MADLKEIHAKRCEVHQVAAEQYVVNCTTAYTSFQYLKEAYEEAKKAVIASGALAVDQHGKIKAGWYQGNSDYENQRVAATNNSGVVVGGGVAGVAGAIGAPVAAWTLVGTLGTASTGAAISGLSGAAHQCYRGMVWRRGCSRRWVRDGCRPIRTQWYWHCRRSRHNRSSCFNCW